MKNDSLKKVFSAIAVTAVAVSATSVTAFADARNGLTDAEIEASAVKPKITASQITMTLDQAKASIESGEGVTWSIIINGADGEYCSTGMHVYYDDRLEIAQDKRGNDLIKKGEAGEELSQAKELDNENAADYAPHAGSVSNSSKTAGMKGFFVTTAGQENNGYDGQLWDITVNLPADVEAGDLFPIDIVYKSVGGVEDVFLDIDRANLAMQAYAFTKGIYNEDNLNPDEPLEGTPYDGYILIEPGEEETTTTTTTETTTTTTTTETTTTTTTTATTTTSTTTTTGTSTTTSTTGTATTTSTATGTDTTTSTETGTGTSTSTNTSTTAKSTTTGKSSSSSSSKTSTSSSNKTSTSSSGSSPKTGVAGVGVAATGLAIAIGTAFILRKKED